MRKTLICIFTLLSLTLSAQVKVARLAQAESTFRQVRTSALLDRPEQRTGHFRYTAPDMIEWKYDGLENLQFPEQMLGFIRQAVSGDMDAAAAIFDIQWSDMTATMLPKKKQMRRFFEKIEIVFVKEGVARRVILTEPSGDTTEIEFINLKYNIL